MTISRWRSIQSVSGKSPATCAGSISMPAIRSTPERSRRIASRGPSMVSSLSVSSSSGSDVQETISLDLGQREERRRRGAGAVQHAQALDHELRVPPVPTRGQHGDFDGVPQLPRQHAGERVAIGFDLRKDDEADGEQDEREHRESDDHGRPDEAEQRKEDRAGNAEKGAQ